MKTLLAVLLGSSMALSFSAEAVSCRDIGAAVVDQFVAVGRFKVETPEQISAHNGLVESQVSACAEGKKMRLKGVSPKDAGVAMTLAAAHAVNRGDSNKTSGLNAIAMTQTSFAYGYAFGE
ncbi:hypothetical protein YJ25_004425 [Salmonella enterica subsp. enterica]|nr:hypothetical protein [Salmonella enterica subsp. enterica]